MIVEESLVTDQQLIDVGFDSIAARDNYFKRLARSHWIEHRINYCCGSLVLHTLEEWLDEVNNQGVTIYIGPEDVGVPENTQDTLYLKLKGEEGDFIYIKEALLRNNVAANAALIRKSFETKDLPTDYPYASFHIKSAAAALTYPYKKELTYPYKKELPPHVKWLFLISGPNQHPGDNSDSVYDWVDKRFNLVHRSPLLYNVNMGGDPRLMLHVYKRKESNE